MADPLVYNVSFDAGMRTATAQRVYTRASWLEEWVLQPYLWCEAAEWTTAPTLPTASFVWMYGPVKQTDSVNFVNFSKLDLHNYYVRVDYVTDAGATEIRQWFGVIKADVDELGGAVLETVKSSPGGDPTFRSTPTGNQQFTAFGLEVFLADHIVEGGHYDADGTVAECETCPAFNEFGRPNRTTTKPSGSESHVFEPVLSSAEYWSVRDIAEYLLAYQVPKAADGFAPFAWSIAWPASADDDPNFDGEFLAWDKPEMPAYLVSTYALLNQLLNRRRLLLWHARFATEEIVDVKVETVLGSSVSLPMPGVEAFPANGVNVTLDFDTDPLTNGVIRATGLEQVEQVVVRGARRRSLVSVGVADATGDLIKGWTSSEESSYEAGASGDASYASAGTAERQRKNREYRASPELEHVFSLFTLPEAWSSDYTSTGGDDSQEASAVFVQDDASAYFPYYPSLEVLSELFIREGNDYSGDRVNELPTEEFTGNFLRPMLFFRDPTDNRWLVAETIGESADIEGGDADETFNWSAVLIPVNDPGQKGFHVRVLGRERHVIDGLNFTKLAEDTVPGDWSYTSNRGMIATLAIQEDRWAEGVYPPEAPFTDIIRRKVIHVGDRFRQDYVTPGTVVGFGLQGLVRSSGGYIPRAGADDDITKLNAIARLAGQYYLERRRILSLTSHRMPGVEIDLTHLVIQVGSPLADGHKIGLETPITRIRITSALGRGSSQPPTFELETWAGELDATSISPKPPREP